MNKKLLNKLTRKFAKKLAQKYGFELYRPTTLVKNSNSILHIISFGLPPSGLYCNVAVLPIYIPTDVVFYDIGNRLNHFKTILSGNWCDGDTEEEIIRDQDTIQKLIESNVLPWFSAISSPIDFIYMLEKELENENQRLTICPPHLGILCIGFSLMLVKEYKRAEIVLRRAYTEVMEYAPDLITVNPWNLIKPNIELLENNQTDLIQENIEDYVRQTNANLKLKSR